jgi:hypothetical protein
MHATFEQAVLDAYAAASDAVLQSTTAAMVN